MLNHREIELLTEITDRQRKILNVIADYDEGWLTEKALEDKLEEIIKDKKS